MNPSLSMGAPEPVKQTGAVDLRQFPNAHAVAHFAANELMAALEAPRTGDGSFRLALLGGRIASQFFGSFARLAGLRPNALKGVQFFWADERCVPPDDPESNYRVAFETLLRPLNIPQNTIHRIQGELLPPLAARVANTEISSFAAKGRPLLDLIMMGMGEDGHVASLFPGETQEAMDNPASYRAVKGTKPPPNRVTLGYGVIAEAREVWVLVSGAGKAEALKAGLFTNAALPLARVVRSRMLTRVFTDLEVAAVKG